MRYSDIMKPKNVEQKESVEKQKLQEVEVKKVRNACSAYAY